MARGRKPILQDRKTTCISLESRHVEYLQEHGIELSEFVRKSIEALMTSQKTPLEKLKQEIEESKNKLHDEGLKLHQQEMYLEELEKEQALKEKEVAQVSEMDENRIYLFNNKYRKLIFSNAICEADFYGNVKKDFKFEDFTQAKKWLLIKYQEPRAGDKQFTEERIKTFLRYDKDVSKYW